MNARDDAPGFAQLVRDAVLGTQRASPAIVTGDGELDALLAPAPRESPERTLLRAAATLSTIARVAASPRIFGSASVGGAPEDERRRCGPLAANDLRTILETSASLVPEWLALARRYERRVPEELLVALLSFAARAPHLHDDVRIAIDARGRWLAAQDPRWTYATVRDDDDGARTFHEASRVADRAEALRRSRACDPAAGRALLEATWESEQPADRPVLLAALATGLSLADEPFLVIAVAAKRADVRAAANDLLHRLPGSAAVARGIAVADAAITRTGGPHFELEIRAPDACTPEMQRDGVALKSPDTITGERAWWLERSLERVPPAHWRARFARSTGEIFEAVGDTGHGSAARRGMARAVARFRDPEALYDLLELASREIVPFDTYATADHDGLESTAREGAIARALHERTNGAAALLIALAPPWSRAFSRAALDYARATVGEPCGWEAFRQRAALTEALAARVDPAVPNVRDGWPDVYQNERTRALVETMLATIATRVAMFEHFADDTDVALDVSAR